MAQSDLNLANITFPAARTDINNHYSTIATLSSGATAPTVTFANQWWADTTTNLLKKRNNADSAWLTIGQLNAAGFLNTNAGDPNGSVTGNFEGELLFDTTNDDLYSYTGSGTVWQLVGGSSSFINSPRSISGNDTQLASDTSITFSGAVADSTLTLITAGIAEGQTIQIFNKDSTYKLTLGTVAVDGVTGYDIAPGGYIEIRYDSSDYDIANIYNPAYQLLTGGNGHGSTNTRIRRFVTTVTDESFGVWTYTDSATDGGSFTINQNGIYSLVYTDFRTNSASTSIFGFSLNSAQLTTDIQSITNADRLGAPTQGSQAAAWAARNTVSWTGPLSATDVVRPHTNALATAVANSEISFSIARVG